MFRCDLFPNFLTQSTIAQCGRGRPQTEKNSKSPFFLNKSQPRCTSIVDRRRGSGVGAGKLVFIGKQTAEVEVEVSGVQNLGQPRWSGFGLLQPRLATQFGDLWMQCARLVPDVDDVNRGWFLFKKQTGLDLKPPAFKLYPQSEVKLGHSEERKLGTVLFFIHPADTLPVSLTLSLRNGLCLSRSIRLLCQLVLPRYKG